MPAQFDQHTIEKAARCMKALAHPLRLKGSIFCKAPTEPLTSEEETSAIP